MDTDQLPTSEKIPPLELPSLDSETRSLIRHALCQSVIHFLDREKSVWLEGLGILYAQTNSEVVNYNLGSRSLVREERIRCLQFEKCDDTISLDLELYPDLTEATTFLRSVFAKLPLEFQLRVSEMAFSRTLRQILREIRDEIVITGYSNQLSPLGCFFALHNRQGTNTRDWFAGADIFLSPSFQETLSTGEAKVFNRPVLESPWELFEAKYGKRVLQFEIDLARELKTLGYDPAPFQQEFSPEELRVKLAIFSDKEYQSGKGRLLYCTDGMRRFTPEKLGRPAAEFVFQIPLLEETPIWPTRVLTAAWILTQSNPSKTVEPGDGVEIEGSLCPHWKELQAILISEYEKTNAAQLTPDGAFYFRNIIGVSRDEMRIAHLIGSTHFLTLLRHRKLDQVTSFRRTSIFARTVYR